MVAHDSRTGRAISVNYTKRTALRTVSNRGQIARVGIKALVSTNHPILAHLIAIRRCNLECTYCNEFDKVSVPVATEKLLARVDRLGELGTTIITVSGGEPMLHPDLDQVITRIRVCGAVAELLTNAYLLSAKRIRELDDAGLQRMQISIDNVKPMARSGTKSLR